MDDKDDGTKIRHPTEDDWQAVFENQASDFRRSGGTARPRGVETPSQP